MGGGSVQRILGCEKRRTADCVPRAAILRWLAGGLVIKGLLCVSIAATQDLEYQWRGDRFEGTKPSAVGGFGVTLLSASVDFEEQPNQVRDCFRVRYFVNREVPVYIVVRELGLNEEKEKYDYWLKRTQPPMTGWNTYAWATDDVVKKFRKLGMEDLAVVARLNRPEPTGDPIEQIAPVVFYQKKTPARIEGYRFWFRSRETAEFAASVYPMSGVQQAQILLKSSGRVISDRPFEVRWNVLDEREGSYKFVLSSTSKSNLRYEFEFYHQPIIKGVDSICPGG
jgi:hypothetical protein